MIHIAKPLLGEEEKKAVLDVLDSGAIAQGPKVNEFEKKFADYIGTEYAIATINGTTALCLALLTAGIKPGDEVITTPFSFIASSNSILFCGAKPVFVDIDPKTFNINPDLIEEAITEKTKAILPVHLFGNPCNMSKILQIAEDHNLKVIEDACQAHGAEYNGKKAGSFGTGCFSFYATKNMTTGEGGMITTNSKEIAEKAGLIRNHGQKKIGSYSHSILGYNYRMTDIAAAIGLEQLKKLESFNEKRIGNAKILTEGLENIKNIVTPETQPRTKHVFHQYTIRVLNNKRDKLKEELQKKGVTSKIFYPIPIHKQPLYNKNKYNLPESKKAAKEVLSLPIHPGLSKKDLENIVREIKNIM